MSASTATILCAAVLAGLIAGAITAAIETVIAEPLIERAIHVEEHTKTEHGVKTEPPIFSRAVQRKGLVIGLLLYGVLWGGLFGALSLLIDSGRGVWEARTPGWLLAIVLGWAVAWLPFLKYPANPPGVGESETIAYRQLLYLGFVLLSAAGALGVFVVRRRWSPRGPGRDASRSRIVVILYGVYVALLYVVMPGYPDAVRMPANLMWSFRGVSLIGLIVFWMALGFLFDRIAPPRGRTEMAR